MFKMVAVDMLMRMELRNWNICSFWIRYIIVTFWIEINSLVFRSYIV